MAERDDLAYCPAVYGFATYAEADRAKPLRFGPLPGVMGSTIGGAGLGVSTHSKAPEAALAYARFAADPATQRAFALHHGQPAHRAAWEDAGLDARFGGFFAATRATMEAAWVRPRYAGYLAFQKEGGQLVESHLRGGLEEGQLLARLGALHARGAAKGGA
jgi:multiple sugar transport system substrate-binding protein